MNAMRPYIALGKREIWEHKSLWIVPAVIGCLGILFAFYGSGALLVAAHQGMININSNITGVDRMEGVRAFIFGSAAFFNTVMLFMVWFYLMDTLYADRKDRSVLFWKSLPLSDTTIVLSKLFTGMMTAPALMLAAVVVTEIITGILFIIALSLVGVNILPLVFQPGTIILAWITLAFALIVQSLWLLPFYGWFLLCSAWARKLVLAWAVLIPLGAIAAEGLVIRTHYLASFIFGHIIELFITLVINDHYSVNGVTVGTSIGGKSDVFNHGGGDLMTLGSVAHVLVLPEMWIGVAIGIIFVLGAIWLRRNHSEI